MSTYYGDRMGEMERDRGKRVIFRLCAAIPPLVAAAFVKDLGVITDYTGTTGILIALIFPALLSLQSAAALEKRGIKPGTYYSSVFTEKRTAQGILLLGFGLFVYVIASFAALGPPN